MLMNLAYLLAVDKIGQWVFRIMVPVFHLNRQSADKIRRTYACSTIIRWGQFSLMVDTLLVTNNNNDQ